MSSQSGIQESLRDNRAAEAAVNALAIVSRELMATIGNAQASLEECVDGSGGMTALARSGQLLHQVSGVLKLTETYGAALLAEEMEVVCSYLVKLRPGKGREDGLDALTRSMVQLPIYIERLLGGGRDIALVLLPMLNDLRAARGQPLLSEGTLLLLNLSPNRQQGKKPERATSGEDPVVVAAKLRPKFQLALLGWITGADNQRHLKTLSSVIEAFELCATRDDMYQLWWIVNGVLESLQNGGLETSVAIKRLLGQTDRQIKRLIDTGVDAFDEHPVDDLLNNLLYYVARSSNAGERISEIRAAFNLEELLPGDEQVEHARESLSAPSVKLMKTVAVAIKEDLGRVKDVLDIYVRTGMEKPAELVPQLDLLKKISDTLGVLGLGELRGDIDSEIDRLRELVTRGGGASEETLIAIASALLRVEDRLDQQLLHLIAPLESAGPGDEAVVASVEDAEFRGVAEAVMRESIINLARIKETFSQSLGADGNSRGLDSVPALIRGIKAGLLMLGKSRATEVGDRICNLITLALRGSGRGRLTLKETDRLADAIVSIEYYMETVKAGRNEPWYMLDNAEACLAVLRELVQRLSSEAEDEAATSATASTAAADDADVLASQVVAVEIVASPVVVSDARELDPELLELFIEEAKEAIVTMQHDLPTWASAPDDMETLITVRRSFHTLKGSGRMVGAERIADYSWCVESLLNRLINKTLTRTPPMVEFILAAAAVVPELVEQLEIGTEPAADVNLLMARANAFAEGDPNAAVLTISQPVTADTKPDAAGLEMDPVLLDIFSKETTGHLAVISLYIAACAGHEPPFAVTEHLYRACHTLHGSANMANVERGVAVAGALNRYVRRANDLRAGFEQPGIDALQAAAAAIATIVEDINKPERIRSDNVVLIERLTSLTEEVAASMQSVPPADLDTEQVHEEAADEPADTPQFDAEIAAIFSEEAAELLESADLALTGWAQDRTARDHIEALKRHLHTLKGGARMAGIAPMGDLSHELEALLNNIDDGRITPSPQLDALLQQSIDELHRMRDMVLAGKKIPRSAKLESRIHAINAGDMSVIESASVATDTAATDVDAVAEPVEFTAEPEESVSMVIVDAPQNVPPPEAGGAEAEVEADATARADAEAEADAKARAEVKAEAQAAAAPGPAAKKLPVKEATRKKKKKARPPAAVTPPAAEVAEDEIEEAAAGTRSAPTQRAGDARQEFARIDAELLESMLNAAGEISIYHSRLSQQVNTIEFHIDELDQTVSRLREQLRKLENETEAQIMHGHQATMVAQDFDPLELDRYSKIQQLSRALAESASDMGSLKDLLQVVTSEAETLLVQQARVTAELQDGLMRTRMVPFQRHVPRLTRLVRQAATEAGKRAELAVEGASGELDRQVLDKMLPPFEHMMRNAVAHGLESPKDRQAAGKPATGRITIRLHREGAEMVIDVADDGAGLDVEAIRQKACETDLLNPDSKATDDEIMQLILTPGFSTAGKVTQSAGRGVGMDVVANEVVSHRPGNQFYDSPAVYPGHHPGVDRQDR